MGKEDQTYEDNIKQSLLYWQIANATGIPINDRCLYLIKRGMTENDIDNMMKYALRRLVQLNILSAYEIKNKEQIIQNMSSTRFENLYQLCKNAFANSEPMKCDYAIKGLN